MSYLDGFVAAVPVANKQAYIDMAKTMAALFIKCGAVRVVENWGDDVPEGKLTSFTMAVQRKDDEAIVFSWVEWPSKEARTAGWEKAMQDPAMQGDPLNPIFDGKRMIFGGFANVMDES
jgi:uncharacterized protein YbaA (DUF1428 family)